MIRVFFIAIMLCFSTIAFTQTLKWYVDPGHTNSEPYKMINDNSGNSYITAKIQDGPNEYNPNGNSPPLPQVLGGGHAGEVDLWD